MGLNIIKEVAALGRMAIPALKQKYTEVFGEEPRSNNKQWLIRRIAWRLQANQEGGLAERARQTALEIANDADLRMMAPRDCRSNAELALSARTSPSEAENSRSLPPQGTRLTRRYKGRLVEVTVAADGFEYEGEHYKSLTAVASRITGAHWNGYHFFGLSKKGRDR